MEQIYAKVENGKVVGKLQADQEYVDSYEGDDVYIPLEDVSAYENEFLLKVEAKMWRDNELGRYDTRSLVTDDPDISSIIEYRQKLRDWPSTSDFPNTKPTIKDEPIISSSTGSASSGSVPFDPNWEPVIWPTGSSPE